VWDQGLIDGSSPHRGHFHRPVAGSRCRSDNWGARQDCFTHERARRLATGRGL